MSKRNIYPPQIGVYKVISNRKTASWQDFDNARLQISMEKENQTGEKLRSLLEWACAGRFINVEVIVSDTLNWFNLAHKYQIPEEKALELALESGDEWIENNHSLKDHKVVIRRWNEWYRHEDYSERLDIISSIYSSNLAFKKSLEETAARIWLVKSSETPSSFEEFFPTSKSYILSELAVFSIMFNEKIAIDIYPGSWLRDIFEILGNYSNEHSFLNCFRNKAYLQVEFIRNRSFADTF